jgi:hypothetical protein
MNNKKVHQCDVYRWLSFDNTMNNIALYRKLQTTILCMVIGGTVCFYCGFERDVDAPVHIVGRVDQTNPSKISIEWPGVTIETAFEGTLCTLAMNHHPNNSSPVFSSNFYNIIIDEKEPFVIKISSDTAIVFRLTPGHHTVQMIKRTEAFCGRDEFLGFCLEEGNHPLPVKGKTRRIEFIGNSQICGWGNEGKVGEGFSSATENCYQALGYITARNCDAECFLIGFSGKGLCVNGDAGTVKPMPVLYNLILPEKTDGPEWDFSSWIPHAVVVNLGSNDYGCSFPPDSATFFNAYVSFVKRVRSNYKNAPIFCVTGPIGSYGDAGHPAGKQRGRETLLSRIVNNSVRQLTDDGLENIFFLSLSPIQIPLGMGADRHPNVYQHTVNAAELTAFIKEKMNW